MDRQFFTDYPKLGLIDRRRWRRGLFGAAATAAILAAQAGQAAPPARGQADQAATIQALLDKVDRLEGEVSDLRAQVQADHAGAGAGARQAAATGGPTPNANPALTPAEGQAVPGALAAAPSQDASATAGVTSAEVDSRIAAAVDKAHHSDKFYFKGITLTPGGFLELAGVYRQHFEGTDIGSNLLVPFPNVRASHASEGRFSARQSRFSLLAEGAVNPHVMLGLYGEIDFLGAAQSANSVESNSYNPRMRNLYATIDWNRGSQGWHLLAGQSWSLATLNSKGITPRNEVPPPQIDAQFIPGFVWTRQPGVRLTADFLDHRLWAAVAVENAQTSFGGTVPATVVATAPGALGFNAANMVSLNTVPDVIGKLAYEADLGSHHVHLEAFGMRRSFDAQLIAGGTSQAHGYGVGGGVIAQMLPGLLDLRVTALHGDGVGRYGTSGLPDVTFSADGRIHPITETALLGGLTLHATKALDLYGFAGEERQDGNYAGTIGVGNPAADNLGCFVAGGICNGNTRRVRQLTGGFWDKIYSGAYGMAQVGFQYSYTQRQLFAGVGGAPQVGQNMGFMSFRYFPF